MANLNPEFLAWLAGFWEGEGSLTVTDKRTCFAVFQSGEGGKRVLEEIRKTLGAGRVYGRVRAGNPNKAYTFHVCSVPSLVKVVTMLLPHLRLKKQEVEEKLETLKRVESTMVSSKVPRRHWANEERAFLAENYGKLSTVEIAERLGRTYSAVNGQIWWMGLRKESTSKQWTLQEIAKLQELTEKGYTAEKISKTLGRTTPAVYNRWRKLEISGKYLPDPIKAINVRRELWRLQRTARGASGVNPKYL